MAYRQKQQRQPSFCSSVEERRGRDGGAEKGVRETQQCKARASSLVVL